MPPLQQNQELVEGQVRTGVRERIRGLRRNCGNATLLRTGDGGGGEARGAPKFTPSTNLYTRVQQLLMCPCSHFSCNVAVFHGIVISRALHHKNKEEKNTSSLLINYGTHTGGNNNRDTL